jgi:hypothetical protein
MSARKRSYAFLTLSSVFVLWPASPATFAAAPASQAQSQMRQRATRAAAGPIKLDIQPDVASAPIRSKVSLKVFIRNAYNQPATWDHPCTVNLEITFPSKRVERQTVVIPKGQNFGVAMFVASEYGVAHRRPSRAGIVLRSMNSAIASAGTRTALPPMKCQSSALPSATFDSTAEQVRLQPRVAAFLGPQRQRNRRQVVHDRNRVAVLREVDRAQ